MCLRWTVRWRAALRGAASARGSSNPGVHHLIFEGRRISWNSSQVHVQEETAVSEGVDGGSTSDYLLLACLRVTFPIFATISLNIRICISWCTLRKACSTVPVTSCQPCKCSTIYYCTICPPPSPSTPSPPVPPTAPPSPSLPWPAPSENATTTATPIPPPGCDQLKVSASINLLIL